MNADKGIPDTVSNQKNGVVTISVYDCKGKQILAGSGFVLDKSGVIATSCNIIAKWFEKGNTIDVEMPGVGHFPLEELISSGCENHLAMFTVKAKDLAAINLNRDYKLRQGEDIVVIGGPSTDSAHTFFAGKIKGLGKKRASFDITDNLIPGLEGGPVFNTQGQVVGAVVSERKKTKTLSFAASVREIAGHLDKYRKTKSPIVEESPVKLEENVIHLPAGLPDDPQEFFSLGCSYYDLKRLHGSATEAYQQSMGIKPDFPDAHINLGVDFYRLGEYENAVDAFNEALQRAPDSLAVCNKLATAYILCGSYAMAISTLKKAVEIDPGDITSHFNLGIAYYLSGDLPSAFDQYLILKKMDKEQADRLMDVIF